MNSGNYAFSADWFSCHAENWTKHLAHLAGQAHLSFLEIGSFEGRSTVWLLENILTHETSRIDCIDSFAGSFEHRSADVAGIERRFDHNISASGNVGKVRKIKGCSQEVLRTLPLYHYDFAYVDGSHLASDVLEDAILCQRLLKDGGTLIFDDYEWDHLRGEPQHPGNAIDAFTTLFRQSFAVVHRGYQIIMKKLM